jgi:hypothetical protein
MESKVSKALEEYAEWRLPEEPVAEARVPDTSAGGTLAAKPQDQKERERAEITEIRPYVEDMGTLALRIELTQHTPKPANFIPRDGLLARCVKMLRAEGYSQARIARELRLNKRTVSRLR